VTHQVAICQPHYIPWIGYFEMIDRVDEFVFLDDVDVIQRDWKTRNKIRKERTGQDTKWLSVPIAHECRRLTPISEALIGGDGTWRKRHIDAFTMVYREAPYFLEAKNLLQGGLAREASTLADLNIGLIKDVCEYMGIETPTQRASNLPSAGKKTSKLLALCDQVKASAYLANNGSACYLEESLFQAAGIQLTYQDYEHPSYSQFSAEQGLSFLSHLTVLDLIANQGPHSLDILRQGRPACAT
jgi:hypothetical protein